MARTIVGKAARASKESFRSVARLGGMKDQINNLPFGNSPDLIEVKPSPAFAFLRVFGGPKKRVYDHGHGGGSRSTKHGGDFPIGEQDVHALTP